MTTRSSATLGIEDILTEAAEVQLASFNAGIEFWSQWVQKTTQLSKAIEKRLDTFKSDPSQPIELLMEITEDNRAYLREMNNLPREVANKFVNEMDRLKKGRGAVKKPSAKPTRRARAKI